MHLDPLLGSVTAEKRMSVSEPQIRLAILGSAMVSLYVIAASEGGGSTRVPYEGTRTFPSSHTPRSARFLAIHQEAGRLRRKVAATLFFKVFDPGGSRCNISCSCFCRPRPIIIPNGMFTPIIIPEYTLRGRAGEALEPEGPPPLWGQGPQGKGAPRGRARRVGAFFAAWRKQALRGSRVRPLG